MTSRSLARSARPFAPLATVLLAVLSLALAWLMIALAGPYLVG